MYNQTYFLKYNTICSDRFNELKKGKNGILSLNNNAQ